MKSYVSKAEMEELGEGLIKHYAGSSKEPLRCVDIEGFITEYLGLTIEYVSLAESDKDKIGFVSDGRYPLKVFQDGAVIERVFPVNTIVLDRLLLRAYESGRRRFTMAHEAAHIIFERINPEPVACFHRIYDTEQTYDVAELAKRFNFEETQASAMAAVLLMPQFLVEQALRVFNGGRRLPIYGSGVLHPREKVMLSRYSMQNEMYVEVKEALLTKESKSKGRKRVAAYCRVSTDEAEQLTSYATQIAAYTERIMKNPQWEMVGIFADEGTPYGQNAKSP